MTQDVALLDDVAAADLDRGHRAGVLGEHRDLHLHRLQQHDGVADRDRVARARRRPSARWRPSRRRRPRSWVHEPWRRRYTAATGRRLASQQRVRAAGLRTVRGRLLGAPGATTAGAGQEAVRADHEVAEQQPRDQGVRRRRGPPRAGRPVVEQAGRDDGEAGRAERRCPTSPGGAGPGWRRPRPAPGRRAATSVGRGTAPTRSRRSRRRRCSKVSTTSGEPQRPSASV